MKILLIVFLIALTGCNNSSDSSKSNSANIAPGGVVTQNNDPSGPLFIQQSFSQIPTAYQIQQNELQEWTQEGLLTPSEASELLSTIQ